MSAALQAAPHQPTSGPVLATPPLGPASPPNRRYPSSHHDSPTRESHASQHVSGAAISSSSRRPTRQPGTGESQSNAPNCVTPTSSRATAFASAPIAAHLSEHHGSPPDRRGNMPTAVPPRTSSHQKGSSATAGCRRTQGSEQPNISARRVQPESAGEANGKSVYGGSEAAPSQNSRSRRQQQHMGQEPPHRSSSTRESRPASSATAIAAPSHPHPSAAGFSHGPARETSQILHSLVVSQPEEDLIREKERIQMAQLIHPDVVESDVASTPSVMACALDDGQRGPRSRHDHSKREKHTKFGEYILGNTIGEGEFGKVKLGWKQEGGVQVAIKLIKKDQLGSNPTRMAKIMREVSILKQLTHPNIVRLHKMEESERHYGIVLEYASGGELFDYILNHRYLKDSAARRLFAQLVSGVGYLHKKGIVHRDLKLENLLLDRNRNIIITDFGFANTFDPAEELSEEEELGLNDREFVKRMGLDKIKGDGCRKGDLMQTSCGSPCYAAPELVVSDSLYTGRKVDVWSCGVILYAMLAGYLPFDDDPANPEGDNINLLYKYIVNTPLTFPEYVTPHARDLLRRILVPNPRKRADLFEVARHSWLSEYAHVVELITSSTTTSNEIQNTTVPTEDGGDAPMLMRSASVRESSKKPPYSPIIGGLVIEQGMLDPEVEAANQAKQQRDNKRRTVQVEYVAPNTITARGDLAGGQPSIHGKTRVRSGGQGLVEIPDTGVIPLKEKPLPPNPQSFAAPRQSYGGNTVVTSRRPPSTHRNNQSLTRPSRDTRAPSDSSYMTTPAPTTGGRPATGGSMQSTVSRVGTRASYGQPVPPEVADTNAHGRIQQPSRSGSKHYAMHNSPHQDPTQGTEPRRPNVTAPKATKRGSYIEPVAEGSSSDGKCHKRSSTMTEIGGRLFGRSGSLFGSKSRKRPEQAQEKSRRYPPVSMNNSMIGDDLRVSIDSRRSRRSFSVGLGKKRSGSISGSQTSHDKQSRRFSFIPGSFSLKAIGIGKDSASVAPDSQSSLPVQHSPLDEQLSQYGEHNVATDGVEASKLEGLYAQPQGAQQNHFDESGNTHPKIISTRNPSSSAVPDYSSAAVLQDGSESSADHSGRPQRASASRRWAHGREDIFDNRRSVIGVAKVNANANNRAVLQKNKRFVDAWGSDDYAARSHDHSGSSGPARKVMDFFRRRGKARGGEGS